MITTLNDLKEINLNAAILSENMTDDEWQDYLARMKMIIKPVKAKMMSGTTPLRLKAGEKYHGETQSRRYQNMINNILHNIRLGEVDYCFFIYQISSLLKYEHDLKAKWLPDYGSFEISL